MRTKSPKAWPSRAGVALAKSLGAGAVVALTGLSGSIGAHATVPASCALGTASPYGALTGNGVDPRENLMGSIGSHSALMLFVDFADATSGVQTSKSVYSSFVPQGQEWLAEVSNHRFELDIDVMRGAPWVRMPNPASSYGFVDGATFAELDRFLTDAMWAAATQGASFAGQEAVAVVVSSSAGPWFPRSAAQHSPTGIPTPDGVILHGGLELGNAMYDFSPNIRMGAFVHETMHLLGLPDLYSGTNEPVWDDYFRYVGPWDVMSSIRNRAHLTTWQQAHLGWIDSDQIACVEVGGSFVLTPSELEGGLQAIAIRTGTNTVVVAENRQLLGQDSSLCDHGLLVYSVNSMVAPGLGPVRVLPAAKDDTVSPNWATCGKLWNATFDLRPGKNASFRSNTLGITITVTHSSADGNITVRVVLAPSRISSAP